MVRGYFMDPRNRRSGRSGRMPGDERQHGMRKSQTIPARRLKNWNIFQDEPIDEEILQALDEMRPKRRADCLNGPRPCPWVSCKYHLYLDINPRTGSIKLNFPNIMPWEMTESCVLDIADRGPVTLEDVGKIMNLTRERIRQLEASASEQIRATRMAIEYKNYTMEKKNSGK